jgi:hypothetical protein
LRLLPKLRQDGFNYLALEALDPTPDDLTQRGFPLESSGTYTKEPVFGELIRSAIELGFKVVPYEHSSAQGFSPEKREAAQAENLLKIIRSDPDARIVIHAGHDHIYKTGRIGDSPTMAQKLMKAIPADRMLMIDQTQMIAANASTSTAYESALAKWSGSGPFVVRSADGQFYSAEPDRYDISVFFAPDTLAKGRPAWLDLNGIRSSRVVSSSVCDGAFPCLVEVHYNAEMDNAVAADRYVFTAPSQETFMYTRRRGVVFSVTDKNGTRSIAEPASLSPYKLPF